MSMDKDYYYQKIKENRCTICALPNDGKFRQCIKCRLKRSHNRKNLYNTYKVNNLCTRCLNIKEDISSACCNKCKIKYRDRQFFTRRRSLLNNICVYCHKNSIIPNVTYCIECANKTSDKMHERYLSNKVLNNCTACGKNIVLEFVNKCGNCWFKSIANRYHINTIWQELKNKLIEQNYKCFYTNKILIPGINASLDHIIPRSRGGNNDINNLRWVDYSINFMKGDLTHSEFVSFCKDIANKDFK